MTIRHTFFTALLLLSLAVPAGFGADTAVLLPGGEIQVTATFDRPAVAAGVLFPAESGREGLKVQDILMRDVRSAGYPGEPVLPVKPVVICIPQGTTLDTVTVDTGRAVEMPGLYTVSPGQYQVPLSATGPFQHLGLNPDVYSARAPYPVDPVEKIQVHHARGYTLVAFNLRPVRYFPGNQRLEYFPEMTATVTTRPVTEQPENVMPCRGLESDREWVQRIVLNPDMAAAYRADTLESQSPLSGNRDNYPYVVVTSGDLSAAFDALITHKMTRGVIGTVVTMDWVEANYTGSDWAEQLRNFIIDAYANWNTEYVLLGGDHDKSDVGGESGDSIVPRRDFYSDTDYGESDNAIPADMYFACLDGSFNYDNDSLWAEPTDGVSGGEVDWFGEVHVGRACVDSLAEAQEFVSTLIAYETTDPDAPHMNKALMVGELLWTGSPNTYGGDYKDEIKNGASTHGYTTEGFPADWIVSSLYDRDLASSWSASQLENLMNANNLHVINHLGHSDVTYCARMYNSDVDNDLTNTNGFFMYSQGCYDGSFDNRGAYGSVESQDCICEHHHYQTQGAFAFVGNSRYGWGEFNSTNGSSQYYDREFFDAVFGEEITNLGAANQDSKEDNIGFLDYGANRWCAYELNLFGCPQTPLGGGYSQVGTIMLDKPFYGNNLQMTITVSDIDLNTQPGTVETTLITVTASGGDTETVTLTESGPNSAVFTGSMIVTQTAGSSGNGSLNASHGEEILAVYVDEDDGAGGVNIDREASAEADFIGPEITGVSVDQITDTSAVIHFTTNEDCGAEVAFGVTTPPAQMESGSGTGTTHAVKLTELEDCTVYLFSVTATDIAGNSVTDNLSGSYYNFITFERVEFINESMDTNPGWTAEPQWAWGQPTGGSGDHGDPDPTSGYTGNNVYGYNLSGGYTNSMSAKYLTTSVIDCSQGSGTMLSFWCWLGVERSTYDHASIQITNGGSWETIWSNPDGTLDGGEWEYWEFDVSDVCDGQSSVQVRWVMGATDSGWTYCGWNIDDVMMSSCQPCTSVPTPTPNPTFTPTPEPTATPGESTATPTPDPTATPEPMTLGVNLELNQATFRAGDPFVLTCTCSNPGPETTFMEFIILDVYGQYFFWPTWSDTLNYEMTTMPAETQDTETIMSFDWPAGNFGVVSGLKFWGALLDPGSSTVAGELDWVTFGYE